MAKKPDYKCETVFFDRFCYDFVSLLGVNLLFLDAKNLEMIIRKVHTGVSYNFDIEVKKGVKPLKGETGIRLVALECIKPQFTDDLQKTQTKNHISSLLGQKLKGAFYKADAHPRPSPSQTTIKDDSGRNTLIKNKNQSLLDFENKVQQEINPDDLGHTVEQSINSSDDPDELR